MRLNLKLNGGWLQGDRPAKTEARRATAPRTPNGKITVGSGQDARGALETIKLVSATAVFPGNGAVVDPRFSDDAPVQLAYPKNQGKNRTVAEAA